MASNCYGCGKKLNLDSEYTMKVVEPNKAPTYVYFHGDCMKNYKEGMGEIMMLIEGKSK